MVFSRTSSLRAAARGVHTSALLQQSLPALTVEQPKPSLMSAIFGGKANTMPPMDQPVPGLAIPTPPAAPASAPATQVTTLANGATIASEETMVSIRHYRPSIPQTQCFRVPAAMLGRARDEEMGGRRKGGPDKGYREGCSDSPPLRRSLSVSSVG